MDRYGPYELLAYTGARMLTDDSIVFTCAGIPIISTMFAQRTHAPNLNVLFESGALASILDQGLPVSIGDTRAAHRSVFAGGLCDAFEMCQRGYVDYAFIGGAQIDMYGNINSHFLGGTYNKPDLRFPGVGGAGSMAANCQKTIVVIPLEKRRFVRKVDFISSMGFGDGSPEYRQKAGVSGSGPYRVVTKQAVFGFDRNSHRMMLLEIAPKKTTDDIQDMVAFELLISPDLKEIPEPTEEELFILRYLCDTENYYLKREIPR